MPLLEDEPKFSLKMLLLVGIPVFVLSITLSLLAHHYAHIVADKYFCGTDFTGNSALKHFGDKPSDSPDCPAASLIAIGMTGFLAVISFGCFIHYPRNLFFGSMAFINAASRIPDAFKLFLQMLFDHKNSLRADEGSALQLIHFKDPTAGFVLLAFYLLLLIFLTIFIIHDTRTIRKKWIVAAALFALMIPSWELIAGWITPPIS